MRGKILILLVLVAGCTSSLERVKSLRDTAPEWYEARKVELRGQGYPKVADIPDEISLEPRIERLALSQEETLAALALFEGDERSFDVEEAPLDMLTWAKELRDQVEQGLPPAEFLSDEEVAAMRATFDRPRGRL